MGGVNQGKWVPSKNLKPDAMYIHTVSSPGDRSHFLQQSIEFSCHIPPTRECGNTICKPYESELDCPEDCANV